MAVYILGAGASYCTDAYSAFGVERGWMGDFRPPVMANFFKVARSRLFPEVPLRDLDSVLKPVGLSVAAIEKGKAGCANIEHVLSFCDLLERAIAHWAFGPRRKGCIRAALWLLERAMARSPLRILRLAPEVRRLCRKVKGWPILGDRPKGTLVRAADALRKAARESDDRAPPSNLPEWQSVWFGLGLNSPLRDVLEAICEVYAPRSPYMSSSESPGLCSNYSEFLVNKVRAGDTVLTFNYDFLLDRVIEEKRNLRPGQPLGHFPTLFDTADGSARFLKLHGSVLWYVQRNEEQERDYYLGNRNAGDICYRTFSEACRKGSTKGYSWLPPHNPPDTYVEPLIVSPTIAKEEHLTRPEISELWHQAERDLSATDRIYVIGYSFPAGDKHVTEMTRAAGKTRPSGSYEGVPLRIVTKSSDHELHALTERVRKAFAGADVQVESNDGFDEWVKKTAQ